MGGFSSADRARALGIESSYPIALTELTQIEACHVGPRPHCPGARQLARELVTLPTHSRVSDRDYDAMVYELERYGA